MTSPATAINDAERKRPKKAAASENNPPPLMTRDQLREFLNSHGFPIGASSLDKLCMPSANQGPPVAAYWNNRPLYEAASSLAWARGKLRYPGK